MLSRNVDRSLVTLLSSVDVLWQRLTDIAMGQLVGAEFDAVARLAKSALDVIALDTVKAG